MRRLASHLFCLMIMTQLGLRPARSAPPSRAVTNETILPRWVDGETLEFTVHDGVTSKRWRISAISGEMVSVERDAALPPTWIDRTIRNGQRTTITFTNRLKTTLQLFWLDHQGAQRLYATIKSGQSRDQSTFAGHAWSLLDPQGQIVAQYVADEHHRDVIIDEATVRRWSELKSSQSPKSEIPTHASAPSRQHEVFVRQHNVWRRASDGSERRLTQDGTSESPWGRLSPSPDGRYVLAMKTDRAQAHPIHLLDVRPKDQLRPTLKTIQYLKPGDRIARPRPSVFDVKTGQRMDVSPALVSNPWSISHISWHPDGHRVRMLYNQRGHQLMRYLELDTRTAQSRVLIEESSSTFIDYASKLFLHILKDGDHALWMSERSGRNHVEIVNLVTQERRAITRGHYIVRAVDDVDEAQRRLRVRVLGIDPRQDPYHIHYMHVDLDTGELVRLTRGDGTHTLNLSPDGRFYIDRWSRVDLPPVHELRRTADGHLIKTLARANAARLIERGWSMPERFVAKARDGKTEIWGIIIRPQPFDPDRTYPIVESIYAGPQGHFVPKSWRQNSTTRDVANIGTVVVQIDGMGTNWRSKAFHDVAWKNLGDAGFPDRITWIKQAAQTRPWMNLKRVGIYGGSAGGQSALRALIAHGDFYHVAAADCGSHDNRMDKIWWNELWMGWPVGPHYEEQSNVTQAHRLRGELMLIVGGLDTNVDPASTLQVVDALVKADKDFEFVLLPSAGHGAANTPYGRRRLLDFLRRKLVDVRD